MLLLLEPSLAIEGVYALAASLDEVTRVRGDTPETIWADEPVRFWIYKSTVDEFVKQEEQGFSPLTDAVSM
jgi:hypothetical protein